MLSSFITLGQQTTEFIMTGGIQDNNPNINNIISDAITSLNGNGTITIKGDVEIYSDFEIPKGIELNFFKGNVLKIYSNVKLTLNCSIDAGTYQIFDFISDEDPLTEDGKIIGKPIVQNINVKWFGAKGDDITDDTDAIQKAIFLSQLNHKIVFLPRGGYMIKKSLTIDTSSKHHLFLRIQGETARGSIIRTDSDIKAIFSLEMPGTDTINDMIIKDLTLIFNNTNYNPVYNIYNPNDPTNQENFKSILVTGIKISQNQRGLIENIIFRNLQYDIYADHFWSSTIRNCTSSLDTRYDKYEAQHKNRYRFNEQCNQLLIEGCVLSNSAKKDSEYLVFINGPSSNISFNNCTFEYGKGVHIDNRPIPGKTFADLTNISFIGCYWEWFQYEALSINNNAHVKGVTVMNNYFNAIKPDKICATNIPNSHALPNYAIILGGVKGMSIINSYFIEWLKNPIYSTDFSENINISMNEWKSREKLISHENYCNPKDGDYWGNSKYPIINNIPIGSTVTNSSKIN